MRGYSERALDLAVWASATETVMCDG